MVACPIAIASVFFSGVHAEFDSCDGSKLIGELSGDGPTCHPVVSSMQRPISTDTEPLCDGSALPKQRPEHDFFDEGFVPANMTEPLVEPEALQAVYEQYLQPFVPELREGGHFFHPFWSCNVGAQYGGQSVYSESGKEKAVLRNQFTAPSGVLHERRDCDPLPWLAQFLQSGEWRSIDLGASDGECAFSLLARGHDVTLVDITYANPAMRTWVEMTLAVNDWQDRAVFVHGVATDRLPANPDTNLMMPTLDDLTRSWGDRPLGIVKVDIDDEEEGDNLQLELLRSANETLHRAHIFQIENDGQPHDEVIALLCTYRMQPYAILPDLEEEAISPYDFSFYFNNEHSCHRTAEKRFKDSMLYSRLRQARPGEVHLKKSSQEITHFKLEPLCTCGSPAKTSHLLLARCAYQLAAVRTLSSSFEAVRKKYGACDGLEMTAKPR